MAWGADISDAVTAFIKQRPGGALALSETQPTQRAMCVMLGVVNQYSGTYNFGHDGKAVPFGEPLARSFGTRVYEFYVQDVWKMRPDLTVTYGIRYGSYQMPYEKNGVQVVSTTGLGVYLAERVGASLAGVSGASQPNAKLTYARGRFSNIPGACTGSTKPKKLYRSATTSMPTSGCLRECTNGACAATPIWDIRLAP